MIAGAPYPHTLDVATSLCNDFNAVEFSTRRCSLPSPLPLPLLPTSSGTRRFLRFLIIMTLFIIDPSTDGTTVAIYNHESISHVVTSHEDRLRATRSTNRRRLIHVLDLVPQTTASTRLKTHIMAPTIFSGKGSLTNMMKQHPEVIIRHHPLESPTVGSLVVRLSCLVAQLRI